MILTIQSRLTAWYTALMVVTVLLLGMLVYLSAAWGVRKAADEELTSGLDGIETFLHHKLAIHEMDNLGEELREHSSLMPRGKMFRVRTEDGTLLYQPDAMIPIRDVHAPGQGISKETQNRDGRSYRTISRVAHVGPYTFSLQVAVDQTKYNVLVNRLAFLLLLCMPLAGCLAALSGFWMSHRVLKPVDRITETAKTIDAQHLERRLPLQGNGDELDQLSATINSMLNRIAISYERIAQFTADASHELRAPIAVVRSTAELLMMDIAVTGRLRDGLNDIVMESDSMTRLISDLLTLARGGLEESTGNRELFDLGASVTALIPRARQLATTKQIQIDLLDNTALLPVQGNQMVAERIFMILIDNAIRYSRSGGRIAVSTLRTPSRCGFAVADDGIGIAREHQSRIFDRFYRVNAARTPGDGGSGLGLSIAKSLIDLHGGTINLQSAPGKGSRFEVWFTAIQSTKAPAKELQSL